MNAMLRGQRPALGKASEAVTSMDVFLYHNNDRGADEGSRGVNLEMFGVF